MAGRKRPYRRKTDYVPQSERAYGIQVAHRERPNMTALTELFVRFTLAEANVKREKNDGPLVSRPEVLKPGPDRDSTAEGR